METLTDYAAMLTVILTLLSYSHSRDSSDYRLNTCNVNKLSILSHGVFYNINYCINRLVC